MFNPTSPDKVFHDLTDPALTLRDVADIHNTTLESLTLWMSHPDITVRLDNFQSAIARRVRLLALNYLPAAVQTLHATLIAHNDQELNTPFKPDCIKTREFQRRSRETARKAATLLLRFSHVDTQSKPREDPLDLPTLRALRTNSKAAVAPQPEGLNRGSRGWNEALRVTPPVSEPQPPQPVRLHGDAPHSQSHQSSPITSTAAGGASPGPGEPERGSLSPPRTARRSYISSSRSHNPHRMVVLRGSWRILNQRPSNPMRYPRAHNILALALCTLASAPTRAAIFYDEFHQGDLSNNRLAPTPFTLTAGDNELIGELAGPDVSGNIDRDYYSITIPSGFVLSQLTLEFYVSADYQAFIGIQPGPIFPNDPATVQAGDLLGWLHFGPPYVNTDILPLIGGNGQGFTPPLPAGTYTIWAQQLDDVTDYEMDYVVTPVPAPGSLAAAGLFCCVLSRRRR